MKRLFFLTLMAATFTFMACAAKAGTLTPESLDALKRLRTEKIMCPINLFTNCTLDADFEVESTHDGTTRTFSGKMSTSNRCFSYSHGYIGKMFDEPVEITTASDTTGYGDRLDRWVKQPLDFDTFLPVFSPRKRSFETIGAQLEYLGTENGQACYRIYYVFMEKIPVECRYWCDTLSRCVTRATIAMALEDGSSLSGEVLLNPYSGIGRTSYPQDACYLKFARQIDYRFNGTDGTTRTIRLQNLRLTDIGVYKTGRKEE